MSETTEVSDQKVSSDELSEQSINDIIRALKTAQNTKPRNNKPKPVVALDGTTTNKPKPKTGGKKKPNASSLTQQLTETQTKLLQALDELKQNTETNKRNYPTKQMTTEEMAANPSEYPPQPALKPVVVSSTFEPLFKPKRKITDNAQPSVKIIPPITTNKPEQKPKKTLAL